LEEEAQIAASFVKLFIEQKKITQEEEEKFFYVAEEIIKD